MSISHSESLTVLFEDNHLIGVFKPPRVPIQGDDSGDLSLLDITKNWLKVKYGKPGNVFLGLVHRLDRPVSGVVLFAKTSKAASRLSEQFRGRTVEKDYLAMVKGVPLEKSGRCEDFLVSDDSGSRIDPTGKSSVLSYSVVRSYPDRSLVRIKLETGRKHQIRVQFAARGFPVLGDVKYGAPGIFLGEIALVAERLTVNHPITKEPVVIQVPKELTRLERYLNE